MSPPHTHTLSNSYSAMEKCLLPEDVMLCILSRLPVKTIIRFKSVCKPWFHLFSTPGFKKLHLGQFSSNPRNQSLIVHSSKKKFNEISSEPENKFSIINIESDEEELVDHPFAHTRNINLDIVGCCSGLVCLHDGQDIVMWNPAMKLTKTVRMKACGPLEVVSLGFGYDAVTSDFKVVRIVSEKRIVDEEYVLKVKSAEMYSVSSDSWIEVNVGFQFTNFTYSNALTVSGNLYWNAWVEKVNVFLCFDVMELVFKIVKSIKFTGWEEEPRNMFEDETDDEPYDELKETIVDLVDWNGAFGTISYKNYYGKIDYLSDQEYPYNAVENICVWIFDDGERVWRKNRTFGPFEGMNLCAFFLCTKNEKVVGQLPSGRPFVLDLKTGCIYGLVDDCCQHVQHRVYAYTESLEFSQVMFSR